MLVTDLTGCVTNILHEPQESEKNSPIENKNTVYTLPQAILHKFEPSVSDISSQIDNLREYIKRRTQNY